MIINIQINKDLEVKVDIDDELLTPKKKEIKWEFWIDKKGVGDKIKEELQKDADNFITNL